MPDEAMSLARIDKRPPRDRATLAILIDYSLLDEFMAEVANA